jgi:hypothetical protein
LSNIASTNVSLCPSRPSDYENSILVANFRIFFKFGWVFEDIVWSASQLNDLVGRVKRLGPGR